LSHPHTGTIDRPGSKATLACGLNFQVREQGLYSVAQLQLYILFTENQVSRIFLQVGSTTTFLEFQAPPGGVFLSARARIIPANPGEFDSIRINNIIDSSDGRRPEGHPRLTFDVRNGEISLRNDVHPDDRAKVTGDIRAFCNKYSCHADFVWQNEVGQIGVGLTAAARVIDCRSSDGHQAQGIRSGFGDDTSGCSGIPQGHRFAMGRLELGWLGRIKSLEYLDPGDYSGTQAVVFHREGMEIGLTLHSAW
jgi:hypothetical protein